MRKPIFAGATLLTLTMVVSSSAQTIKKIPVHVTCGPASHDFVGERVCTSLRDLIASSPRYVESGTDDPVNWQYDISLVSVSTVAGGSAGSMELSWETHDSPAWHITHMAFTCGPSTVNDAAHTVFATADGQISSMEEK